MKTHLRLTKAERRAKRHRPKMKVSGASVKTIARLLRERVTSRRRRRPSS